MNYFLSFFLLKSIISICNRDLLNLLVHINQSTNDGQYSIDSNYKECINDLITKGEYDLLELYLRALSLNQIDYKETLMASINVKQKHLRLLKEKYVFIRRHESIEVIHPSIKWKENSQFVFLQIIYSVNHNESLICEYLENVDFDLISDSNLIHFQGDCISKDFQKPICFIADITLEDDLNKLMSRYKDNKREKGRYTVTLKKKTSRLWNKLYRNDKEIPFNLIKWEEDIDNIQYMQINDN